MTYAHRNGVVTVAITLPTSGDQYDFIQALGAAATYRAAVGNTISANAITQILSYMNPPTISPRRD